MPVSALGALVSEAVCAEPAELVWVAEPLEGRVAAAVVKAPSCEAPLVEAAPLEAAAVVAPVAALTVTVVVFVAVEDPELPQPAIANAASTGSSSAQRAPERMHADRRIVVTAREGRSETRGACNENVARYRRRRS